MQIFGKSAAEGRFKYNDANANIDYRIEKTRGGFKITGTAKGRLERIEVFRSSAPKEFLLNNWQSWGPLLKIAAQGKHEGIEEIFRKHRPYVFTPIPETFLKNLVSDYFVVWEEHLAGFLRSRFAHPFFAVEGDELVGYLEYFDTKFEEAIPLEPFVIFDGSSAKSESSDAPVTALNKGKIAPLISFSLPQEDYGESLLEEYADLAAAENRVRLSAWNPVGWSSWYHYFTNLRWEDIEKNLRLARKDFPFEVFQIDDGYEKDIGDWLETKKGFRTLPELAQLIKSHGFMAGIWTAPFSASETSRLFQEHRDWLVRDGAEPKECYRGWGKRIYALDTTRPKIKNWLLETFSSLQKMGFDYFKIDFLFAAAMRGGQAGDFRLLANLSDSSKYYKSSAVPPRSARFSYFTSD